VASATGNHAATMFSANKECPLRHVRYYSDALGSGQHFHWNTVIWCGHDLCMTWPASFRRAAVSYFPGPANANVADNIANKAIE